ncbi:hypothetical protein, partial [uncultured Spirosoma sp.]|uniref:hypothetical protein n=1 Tax=uncultured Spirosoma sp. TaxID=278208 RepID=UPI002587E174
SRTVATVRDSCSRAWVSWTRAGGPVQVRVPVRATMQAVANWSLCVHPDVDRSAGAGPGYPGATTRIPNRRNGSGFVIFGYTTDYSLFSTNISAFRQP